MSERRGVPRYIIDSRVELSRPTGESRTTATARSISVRGCRIRGEAVPAAGQKCQLALEWEGREFRCEVEVAWRKKDGDAGLKFLSLDESQLGFLRGLCATLRLEPLAPLPPEPENN